MKTLRRLALLAIAASACRFGGPSGDPSAYVTFPDEAGDAPDETPDAEPGNPETSIEIDSGDDVSVGPDAPIDGQTGDGPTGVEDAIACTPPANVPVCNPVTNTGCTLGQCDVDSSMTTPTGTCVLASPLPSGEGATCTQTAGSTPCQSQLTCFAGSCKKVCFCDSECAGNECCTGSYGMTGFKLCGACP